MAPQPNPPILKGSRSIPILRIRYASSDDSSSSDSEQSAVPSREPSPDRSQHSGSGSSVDTITQESFSRKRSLSSPAVDSLTAPRKVNLPLSLPIRSIPSSLTLPNLRHKFSRNHIESIPHELTEGYFPPDTPPENKLVGSSEDEWNPNIAIDALEKSLLKTYDKNKPIDRNLYHPFFRLLEFTRNLIAENKRLEDDFEDRLQREGGKAWQTLETSFDPIKKLYLDEIKRIEKAVVEKFGVQEALQIRHGTLLMGDLRRRLKSVKERREREWRRGWDPNEVEIDPDTDYRAGRDLVTGRELGEPAPRREYGIDRKASADSVMGFSHGKGKVGFDALRAMESDESLDKAIHEGLGRRRWSFDSSDVHPLEGGDPTKYGALRAADSQATLAAAQEVEDEAPIQPAPVAAEDTLAIRRGRQPPRIRFAEGDALERCHEPRPTMLSALRTADSQETLVERENMDEMSARLARAGFL